MASTPTGPNSLGPQQPVDQFGRPVDQPPPKKRFSWGTCIVGCLGMMLLSFLICGGVGYYFFVKLPDFARSAINQAIEQSEMSPEDKKIVTQQVDRVVDEYKTGKIDLQKLGTVMAKLAESPLFTLLMVYAAEEKYIKPSSLPDDEKAAAKITLQRIARGVFEKKIHENELDPLLNHISTKQGEKRNFKDQLTEEQLRAFLADCKKTADAAEIPNEPFEVKIGEEFKKAIDEALAPGAPAPPSLEIDNGSAPKGEEK